MTDTPSPDIRARLMQAIIGVLVDGDPIINIGFGPHEITLNWNLDRQTCTVRSADKLGLTGDGE